MIRKMPITIAAIAPPDSPLSFSEMEAKEMSDCSNEIIYKILKKQTLFSLFGPCFLDSADKVSPVTVSIKYYNLSLKQGDLKGPENSFCSVVA